MSSLAPFVISFAPPWMILIQVFVFPVCARMSSSKPFAATAMLESSSTSAGGAALARRAGGAASGADRGFRAAEELPGLP